MFVPSIILGFLLFLTPAETSEYLRFTVLYNNVPQNEALITDWGFACLIEKGDEKILFDTGGDGDILLSNMEHLEIAPSDIDMVLLSHIHADHVGGLGTLLERNSDVIVYLPASFPDDFKDMTADLGAFVRPVSEFTEICEDVYSTGEMEAMWLKEQALIIDTPQGLIVVTGCAHPGIVNIARRSKDLLDKELYMLLGGFHLLAYSEEQVREIIGDLKKLDVHTVGPSHCTGGRPIELFKEAWGDDFLDLGCGAVFEIEY